MLKESQALPRLSPSPPLPSVSSIWLTNELVEPLEHLISSDEQDPCLTPVTESPPTFFVAANVCLLVIVGKESRWECYYPDQQKTDMIITHTDMVTSPTAILSARLIFRPTHYKQRFITLLSLVSRNIQSSYGHAQLFHFSSSFVSLLFQITSSQVEFNSPSNDIKDALHFHNGPVRWMGKTSNFLKLLLAQETGIKDWPSVCVI